ncbi:hypothetical protein [Chryseobacterium sp. EO14]|uniref:hypothetical protein n=1 Tax=Chryseobacterium sp. EO14 TaxID=2950551 RepID=UPI00210C97AE|nr:hypothetical protein [Chryseobacterium sp. EO14]MCQ4139221.1 hypothetical protein [Chryseobacterium sp. EO14]
MIDFTKEEQFLIDGLFAGVKFNDGIAFIFEDQPERESIGTYDRTSDGGIYLVSGRTRINETDGIFHRFYVYDNWGKAFGGRKWVLKMDDGEVKDMTGHWYASSPKNWQEFETITYGFRSSLTSCYVFGGAYVKKGLTAKLMERINNREVSYLSEYYHGEKLLRYDLDRSKHFYKVFDLEKKEKTLKRNLKRLSKILIENNIFFRHGKLKHQ